MKRRDLLLGTGLAILPFTAFAQVPTAGNGTTGHPVVTQPKVTVTQPGIAPGRVKTIDSKASLKSDGAPTTSTATKPDATLRTESTKSEAAPATAQSAGPADTRAQISALHPTTPTWWRPMMAR